MGAGKVPTPECQEGCRTMRLRWDTNGGLDPRSMSYISTVMLVVFTPNFT